VLIAWASRGVFLGTSMGGIITMVIAATAPARIAAAILMMSAVLESAGYQRIVLMVGKNMEFPTRSGRAANQNPRRPPLIPARDIFWRSSCAALARAAGRPRRVDYDQAIAQPSKAPRRRGHDSSLNPWAKTARCLSFTGALSDLLSAEGVDLMRIVSMICKRCTCRIRHAPTLEEETAGWRSSIFWRRRISPPTDAQPPARRRAKRHQLGRLLARRGAAVASRRAPTATPRFARDCATRPPPISNGSCSGLLESA